VKLVTPLLSIGYSVVALIFGLAAVTLMGIAAGELYEAAAGDAKALGQRAASAIEAIGMVTVALMALEMAQTVLEEEVVRQVHVSAPTRVRRYVSRFLVVVVVALSIESLVAVVRALHLDPAGLPRAAAVTAGAALLLAAWGIFVRLNRSVEELEPEGIGEAKKEDAKLE
jgi:hypothetical protein